jgi:Sap, sulfolipid-1-addressing protein
VTIEILVLALANAIRPTSLAAVYALLAAESPRRLMTVYVAAGLAFTVAIGLLVVGAFDGIDLDAGSGPTKAVGQLAGGILVLAFAVGVLTGRVGGRRAEDAPRPGRRWERLRDRRLTLRTAALAGPATHIPGIFYLVALNLIVSHRRTAAGGVFEVLLYNVVWFAIPIAALSICVVRPETARQGVQQLQSWTRRHVRTLVLIVSFAVGAVLVVRGAAGL